MAGTGRAPKDPAQRVSRHQPRRGDWIDLPPLAKPTLPALPGRSWSTRTKRAWTAWKKDPATGMYGPAEIQLAIDLAYAYEKWVKDESAAHAAEVRQRLDGLGLSPKGKQDRRWRLAPNVPAEPSTTPRKKATARTATGRTLRAL